MSRFAAIIAAGAVCLCCIAASAGQAMKDKSQSADKNAEAIKIGVAVLKNTATRSVPVTVERDRLVNAINHIKPPKHSKDRTRIQAVALDTASVGEANEQARDRGCDYVVFTNLTELRESGDPAPAPRPGEIRIGRDPVANDPNPAYRHDVQRYGVMEFQLFRLGDPSPRVDTSTSDQDFTTADGILSALMDRVANRVVSEIRSGSKSVPME